MTTVRTDSPRRTEPDRAALRGRRAVTAVFFLNGLTLASYIVRLPSLRSTTTSAPPNSAWCPPSSGRRRW